MLSVVVPVYNEVEALAELDARLRKALDGLGACEIVLVDDGSSDGSWAEMRRLAAADRRIRLVKLSRNFGHQVALTAGLDAARGDAIVTLDADLQDPPELIPELVARWREGNDVVYAVRTEREGETAFKRATARVFYRLIRRLAHVEIPENAGDFRLLSRRAADALHEMPERARFLRGMTSWIGLRQAAVPFGRAGRHSGKTKYPTHKMVAFATDAVTSFSSWPIRLVTRLGLLVVLFCIVYLGYTIYLRFFTDRTVQGWTSVIVVVLLIGGTQLLSLGIIGQYVARIFDEVKGRPLYIVEETVDGGSDD